MYIIRSIMIIYLLLISLILKAADYYVKPGGDNSTNGLTWASAWQTINHACSNVQAGDVVTVSNGQYNEEVTMRSNGTPAARITFRSYKKHQAIIHAAGRNRGIDFNGRHYICIEGFTIRNSQQFGINLSASSNQVLNNDIYSNESAGIYSSSTGSNYIAGNQIWGENQNDAINFNHSCKSTIYSNQIHHNQNGILLNFSDSIIIGNTIYSNKNSGIYINHGSISPSENGGNTSTISNNIIRGKNQDYGIYLNCGIGKDEKIYRNFIKNQAKDGIYLNVGVSGTPGSIINNVIVQCLSNGIQLPQHGGSVYNNIILSNGLYGLTGYGYVDNNIIYGNLSGTHEGSFIWGFFNYYNDPLTQGNDYSISSAISPAVDNGKIISGVSDSYKGKGPDIGWRESSFAKPDDMPGDKPDDNNPDNYDFNDVRVFPNYLTSGITEAEIWTKIYKSGQVKIKILNESGQVIWEQNIFMEKGMNSIVWKKPEYLGSGMYVVFLRQADGRKSTGCFAVIK